MGSASSSDSGGLPIGFEHHDLPFACCGISSVAASRLAGEWGGLGTGLGRFLGEA